MELGVIGHAVCEFDGEVAQGAWPVGCGLCPFPADVPQCQVEELEERVDGGEEVAVVADLAQRAVERFDGVGGVDDPADLRREVEEGGDLAPVRLPAAPIVASLQSSPWPILSKAGRRKSPACGASPKTTASPKASTAK